MISGFTKLAIIAIVLGLAVLLIACNARKKRCPKAANAVSVELVRTSQSWNGVELPDYPQGRPEIVAVKYTIPPGQRLGWHHHVSMNHGVLMQGEMTIIGVDGATHVLHEGDVVVEMVDSVHHGMCTGSKPAILYMFYLSQKDLPLSVQHPEIPME